MSEANDSKRSTELTLGRFLQIFQDETGLRVTAVEVYDQGPEAEPEVVLRAELR